MALRLGGLADLDPTAVPLPVGTEVTTRVDRVIEGGIREKGASARVTAVEDGRAVMATGEILTDVNRLAEFVPPEIDELIAIKRLAEAQQLSPEQVATWRPRLAAAIEAVDKAWPTSVLPTDAPPEALAALDAWLREVRRAHW